MFLQQIYCTQGTSCSSCPLEKRKVIKKGLLGSSSLSIILGVLPFILFAFPVLWEIYQQPEAESASMPSDFLAPWRFGTLAFEVLISIIIIVAFSILYQSFYYRFYFYDLQKDHVVIRKGVISRVEAAIAYSKIQNVFVDQDFWDRIFGLCDVHIATADFQSARIAHIDGVNGENAKRLKDEIMRRMQSTSTIIQTSNGI